MTQGNVWTCTSERAADGSPAGFGAHHQVGAARTRRVPAATACVQLGEDCDDGNTVSCDGCSADCRAETGCGDGVRCGNEECDDGNTDNCDGCSATCTRRGRRAVRRRHGRTRPAARNAIRREPRAPPSASASRRAATASQDAGEECDDGNTVNCDGCTADCRVETGCGDGVRCGSEACDDGNQTACDGCSPTCEVEAGTVAATGSSTAPAARSAIRPAPDARSPASAAVRRSAPATSALADRSTPRRSVRSRRSAALHGAIDLVAGTPDAERCGAGHRRRAGVLLRGDPRRPVRYLCVCASTPVRVSSIATAERMSTCR